MDETAEHHEKDKQLTCPECGELLWDGEERGPGETLAAFGHLESHREALLARECELESAERAMSEQRENVQYTEIDTAEARERGFIFCSVYGCINVVESHEKANAAGWGQERWHYRGVRRPCPGPHNYAWDYKSRRGLFGRKREP